MDQVYTQRPTTCDILWEKIKRYKREHPRLNSSQLARKWDLSSSTINRIENRDIKNVSIDIAVKVLRGTGNRNEIPTFIRNYFPDVHDGLFEYFVEQSRREDIPELEQYFTDESTYKMMLMASTKAGLSEAYVREEFGRSGHDKFMKLASKGIFVNVEGRFFVDVHEVALRAEDTLKINELVFRELSSSYKNNGNTKKTDFNTMYESVNLKRISSELLTLSTDYRNEVRKLLKDKRNQGDDLIMITSLIAKLN